MSRKNRRKKAQARALANVSPNTMATVTRASITNPPTINSVQTKGVDSMNDAPSQQTIGNNPQEAKIARQIIMEVPLSELSIEKYQRETRARKVRGIVNGFNEAKLGLLVVSDRDGAYRLLDGANRATALRALNFTHARCIVLQNMTYEEEAEYFSTQKANSSTITPYDQFNADIEAKKPDAMVIREIVQNNGFGVKNSGRRFDCISAVHALRTVMDVYGPEVLHTTLRLIRETWNGIKDATKREYIVGLADFVNRFGDPNFAAVMRNKNMQLIWQEYLKTTSQSNRKSSEPTMRNAFCRAILSEYNKGLRSNKRLTMEG